MKPLILVILLLPQLLSAQQAWERLTPLPQEHNINSMVKIPGSDRLMAVCNGSTVITSDDGGEHWDLHLNPGGMFNDFNMSCIRFFNDTLGFILGNDYTILRTTNGGETWEVKHTEPYINNYKFLNDIDFCNDSTGFAVGSSGKLMRTTDIGETWIEVESGVNDEFKKIEFLSATTGFIPFSDYVDSRVLKTTDGGNTWQIHSNPLGISNDYYIRDIRKVTGNYALISAGTMNHPWVGYIFKSTNAGYIWYQEASMTGSIRDFALYDSLKSVINNYVFPYGNNLWGTNDGGDNWQMIDSDYNWVENLCFYDESEIIISGRIGIIGKSYDGGVSWVPKSSMINDVTLHEVHFPGGNVAYGVALSNFGGGLVFEMVKSLDGGVTWTDNDLGTPTGTIDHLSEDTALRLLEFGEAAVYTTDAWQTYNWYEFEDDPFSWDICIKFLSPENGIATVGDGVYFSLNNVFTSWTAVEGIDNERLTFMDIEPRTSVDALICGGIGKDSTYLMRININEPSDFQMEFLGTYGIGKEIVFVDDNTGFIGCSKNVILRTVNGGITWNPVTLTSNDSLDIKRIKFPTDSVGYAIGTGQYHNMLKTTDKGNTWFPVETYQTSPLLDLHFTDAFNGYIYGEGGLIMHTTTGGVVAVDDIPGRQFSNNPRPFLVVPNPLNDNCHIELVTLQEYYPLNLKVCDLTGKTVKQVTLLNPSQPVSLRDLAKGSYLFKLTTAIGETGNYKVIKL